MSWISGGSVWTRTTGNNPWGLKSWGEDTFMNFTFKIPGRFSWWRAKTDPSAVGEEWSLWKTQSLFYNKDLCSRGKEYSRTTCPRWEKGITPILAIGFLSHLTKIGVIIRAQGFEDIDVEIRSLQGKRAGGGLVRKWGEPGHLWRSHHRNQETECWDLTRRIWCASLLYILSPQRQSSNIMSGLKMKVLKDTDSLTGGVPRKDQSQELGQIHV